MLVQLAIELVSEGSREQFRLKCLSVQRQRCLYGDQRCTQARCHFGVWHIKNPLKGGGHDHFCNGIPKWQRTQFVHRVSVELNFNLCAYALYRVVGAIWEGVKYPPQKIVEFFHLKIVQF